MSERITEDYVLDKLGVKIGDNPDCYVYDQGGSNAPEAIKECLKECGGKPEACALDDYATKGPGLAAPEYIVAFKKKPDLLLVVECKAPLSRQASTGPDGIRYFDKPKGFADDGALYYAKYLKKKFNVIALGVSGTDEQHMLIDTFYWTCNVPAPVDLKKKTLEKAAQYLLIGKDIQEKPKDLSPEEIRQLARDMHEEMRNAGIQNKYKALFIADLLLSLEDDTFRDTYESITNYDALSDALKAANKRTLGHHGISPDKTAYIGNEFQKMLETPDLKKVDLTKDGSIRWYLNELRDNIFRLMGRSLSVDVLGVFYSEFVSFGGGDGNDLGIVLTPEHLCDFMAKLIRINKNDYVVDTCCGSGSFLVTAMRLMIENAAGDTDTIKHIRGHQLYGIERDDDLQTLAMTNMIIRNDGHSHIFKEDSFDLKAWDQINDSLNGQKFTKGLINPPYSQKKKKNDERTDSTNNHSELEFLLNLLNRMAPNGEAAIVCPMSCAIGTKFKEERRKLMESHTLEAVFSMPDDLFYPTGVNTCVMVWKAHTPHDPTIKTYFGYCKDDGFVKAKKKGRIDKFGKWNDIEKEWLNDYFDKKVISGKSALQGVKNTDEWLCEAYMETDYSALTVDSFEQSLKDYAAYLMRNGKND